MMFLTVLEKKNCNTALQGIRYAPNYPSVLAWSFLYGIRVYIIKGTVYITAYFFVLIVSFLDVC